MPSHFRTYGPFHLLRLGDELETKQLNIFWNEVVERDSPGLPGAMGIYVLAIKKGSKWKAIYVGRAEQSFKNRLKANHDALRKGARKYFGKDLELLLVARTTPGRGSFIRPHRRDEGLKSVRDLEVLLIREFLLAGAELLNSAEKKFFEELVVPGYIHDEDLPASKGAAVLRGMLGGKNRARS